MTVGQVRFVAYRKRRVSEILSLSPRHIIIETLLALFSYMQLINNMFGVVAALLTIAIATKGIMLGPFIPILVVYFVVQVGWHRLRAIVMCTLSFVWPTALFHR